MIEIRAAQDADAHGLIRLIGAVFDEYPGCVLDVEGEMPELLRIASDFEEHGGVFWIAENAGAVVGCIGFTPSAEPGGIELKKLYVSSAAREGGLGGRLVERVESTAEARGAGFIDLWSDTRFLTAHAFYRKRGYVPTGATRELHDKSNTLELYFKKSL